MRRPMFGYIQLTFVDEDRNAFVTLGGAGWPPEEAKRRFDDLPAGEPDSPYCADLIDTDGFSILDTRLIPPTLPAQLLGSTIEALLERGYERIKEDGEVLAAALSGSAAEQAGATP